MNDRRIFQRFDSRYPAKFKDTRSDYGENVLLRDASAEGMRLKTKDRLYLNDHVALEVELPDSREPMVLKGRVVWAKKHEESGWDLGVRFHEIDLFAIARMYRHVDFPAHK